MMHKISVVWANEIIKKNKTIDEVPNKLQDEVRSILTDMEQEPTMLNIESQFEE